MSDHKKLAIPCAIVIIPSVVVMSIWTLFPPNKVPENHPDIVSHPTLMEVEKKVETAHAHYKR